MNLFQAILAKDFAAVQRLLRENADVNKSNDEKDYPLHLAARVGDPDIMNLLLSHKATVVALNKRKQTPLHLAALNGHRRCIEILVNNKADINGADQDKRTPLHLAVLGDQRSAVSLLLKLHANPLMIDLKGQTALHIAAEYGRVKMLSSILKRAKESQRALLAAQDEEGKTCLHYAAATSSLESLRFLIANGSDVNAETDYGYTPLFFAIRSQQVNVVKELLNAGALLIGDNVNQQNPIDYTEQLTKNVDILNALKERQQALINTPETEPKKIAQKALLECDLAITKKTYDIAWTRLCVALTNAKISNDLDLQISVWKKLVKYSLAQDNFAEAAKYLMAAECCHHQKHQAAYPVSDQFKGARSYVYLRKYLLEQFIRKENPASLDLLDRVKDQVLDCRAIIANMRTDVRNLLKDDKADISQITKNKITFTFKLVISILGKEAIKILGEPPCAFALACLGSMSRDEMSTHSDAELLILLAQLSKDNEAYFRKLAMLIFIFMVFLGETPVSESLLPVDSPIRKGFCWDEGPLNFLNKQNEQLIGTPEQLAHFHHPDFVMAHDGVVTNAMKNIGFVMGEEKLLQQYDKAKAKILSQKNPKKRANNDITVGKTQALSMMSAELRWHEPLYAQREKQKRTFNVKDELYRLPNCMINNLSIIYQLTAKNTWDRLNELVQKKKITQKGGEHLKQAISAAVRLRILTHLYYNCEKEDLFHADEAPEGDVCVLQKGFMLKEHDVKTILNVYRVTIPFHKAMQLYIQSDGKDKAFQRIDFFEDDLTIQGEAYERACQYQQALKAYQNARSANAQNIKIDLALARVEGILGNYDNQKVILLKALSYLAEAGRVKDGDRESLAKLYINLSEAESSLGSNVKIQLDYLEKGLTLYKAVYGENHFETCKVMTRLANAYGDSGDVDKQKQLLEQILAILENTKGTNPALAFTLVSLGSVYAKKGDYPRSKKYLERALEMDEAIFGNTHPHVANTLTHLANTLGAMKALQQKQFVLMRALRIYEQVYGNEHPDVAMTVNNLGNCCIELGDVAYGIELLERAIAIHKRIFKDNPHPSTVITYTNLANAYKESGNTQKLKHTLENAVLIFDTLLQQNKITPVLIDAIATLGEMFSQVAVYDKAKQLLEYALSLQEKMYADRPLKLQPVLIALSYVEGMLNFRSHQLDLLERLLKLQEQHCRAYDVAKSKTLYDLGRVLKMRAEKGDFQKAIQYQNKALQILEQNYEPKSEYLLPVLKELAELSQLTKDNNHYQVCLAKIKTIDAITIPPTTRYKTIYPELYYTQQRKQLVERQLLAKQQQCGEDDISLAPFLYTLADINQLLGEPIQAKILLERTVAVINNAKAMEQDTPDLLSVYNNLCSVCLLLGEIEVAESYKNKSQLIAENNPANLQVAISFSVVGQIYCLKKEYKRARKWQEKALQKIGSEISIDSIKITADLAAAYIGLKQLPQAKELLDKALNDFRVTFQKQHHPYETEILFLLAEIYQENNDYAQAQTYAQQAYDLQQKLFTLNDIRLAKYHQFMAKLQQRQKDVDGARAVLEKAKAIYLAKLGPEHILTKKVVNEITSLTVLPAAVTVAYSPQKTPIPADVTTPKDKSSSELIVSSPAKPTPGRDEQSEEGSDELSDKKPDDSDNDTKEGLQQLLLSEVIQLELRQQAVLNDKSLSGAEKRVALTLLEERKRQVLSLLNNLDVDDEPEPVDPVKAEKIERERRTEALKEKLVEFNETLLKYAKERAYTKGIQEGFELVDKLVEQLDQKIISVDMTVAELKSIIFDGKDSEGWTVLNWMTWFQDDDCVASLITYGADVAIANERGWTPLHTAAFRGHVGIARRLLLAGAKVDTTTDSGITIEEVEYPEGSLPIDMARLSDFPVVIELISAYTTHAKLPKEELQQLLLKITDESIGPAFSPTDLVSSVQCGDLRAVEHHLKQGADPNTLIDGTPAIIFAAKNGDQSMCELLLNYKANVNAKDEKGNTALYFAAEKAIYTLFKLLLDRGGDINLRNDHNYLLHAAVKGKSLYIVDVLLKAKVAIDVEDNEGNTPLYQTIVEKGDLDITTLLLNHGANINHQNKKGDTYLHKAAINNLAGSAEVLLKAGINTQLRNGERKTALQIAQENEKGEVTNFIIRYNKINNSNNDSLEDDFSASEQLVVAAEKNETAQVIRALAAYAHPDHATKKNKWTALHWACWHGNLDMLKEIIKYNPNVNAIDNNGFTPFHLAIYLKNLQVVEFFMEAKADALIETSNYYGQKNKPICRPLSRAIHIAKLVGDSKIIKYLQTYIHQQIMIKPNATIDDQLIAAVISHDLELTKQIIAKGASVDLKYKDIPLVHYAVETGDVESLRVLVEAGADIQVEEKETQGNLLDWAVRRTRSIDILKYLLSLGFDINRPRPSGKPTPLIGACFFANVDVVKLLCERGADVAALNDDGKTALLAVCESKHIHPDDATEIARYLLEHTASDPQARTHWRANAVYCAALSGNMKILDMLLARKIAVDESTLTGWTPLMAAASDNYHLMVTKLIELKANINARNEDDRSVLSIALVDFATESACLLIDAGAEYNVLVNKGAWSPLQLAANKGDKIAVKKLLEKKDIQVDIENKAEGDEHGTAFGKRTPLLSAALNGHAEICEMLILAGASINHCDSKGWTALKLAAHCGRMNVMRVLLKFKKTDVNHRRNDTRFMDAPLHDAITMGYIKAVEILLSHPDIDVNQRSYRDTPLTLAVKEGQPKIVEMLIQRADIDITATDTNGTSPLMIAQLRLKNPELFQVDRDIARQIELHIKARMTQLGKTIAITNLIEAARSEDLVKVKELLAVGADVNETDEANQTALFAATKQNNLAIVLELLQQEDIDPNIENDQRMSPLYYASLYSYTEVAKALLKHPKIEINKVGASFQTPLMFAANEGNLSLVTELLEGGADPNLARPHFGNDGLSPIAFGMMLKEPSKIIPGYIPDHIGVIRALVTHPKCDPNLRRVLWAGHTTLLHESKHVAEFARLLLNHPQTKINLVTKKGYTPLCNNVTVGATEITYMLLARPGINVNYPDKDGNTPLLCAADHEDLSCVQALLKAKGVLVNKANHLGKTPLSIAAKQGTVTVLKALLAAPGIEIDKADKQGSTPLIIAAAEGKKEAVELLIAAGADLNKTTKKGLNAYMMAYAKGHPEVGAYIKEKVEQQNFAKDVAAQSELKQTMAKQAEKRKALERQASNVGQTKEKLEELAVLLRKLQEEEERNAHQSIIQEWEIEAQNYIYSNIPLKTFNSHLQRKLNDLLLSYKTLHLLEEDEINKVTRTIDLLGKTYNLPIVKEVAFTIKEIPNKLSDKDRAKLEAILTLINANKKMDKGVSSDYQELDKSIKITTRLLTYMYEEQIKLLHSAEQIKHLAECAVLHFLNVLASGNVRKEGNIFTQLYQVLITYKPKEGALKPSECKLKTAENKVWTDKGIFQETGVKLPDGRCFVSRNSKTNLYGYRLGTEVLAKESALTVSSEKKAEHPLKDNPFIVPDTQKQTQGALLARYGVFSVPPTPGTPTTGRSIDIIPDRKMG